jgi:hypothetical protein
VSRKKGRSLLKRPGGRSFEHQGGRNFVEHEENPNYKVNSLLCSFFIAFFVLNYNKKKAG